MMEQIKQLSRVLTLSAGLFLLVFAVFPHHHHSEHQTICFSLSCCAESHTDEHTCAHHNATSDGTQSGDESSCGLRQLFLLSLRDECACHHVSAHSENDHQHYDLTLALFCVESYDIEILYPHQHRQALLSTEETLHDNAPRRSIALRAPPVSIA